MISFKQFVEGKGKKQRQARAKKAKERLKNINRIPRPKHFDLSNVEKNVLKFKDRYFFVTSHADIRRSQRGVEDLPDKVLIDILFRSAEYLYNQGQKYLSVDGNYMFYSKKYQQGVIIRVTKNPLIPKERTKMDFKIITWLEHGNSRKTKEADNHFFIEYTINDYLNICECRRVDENLYIEDIKIDKVFEI